MSLGMVTVAAKPLQEVQPLAHAVLSTVQVSCLDSDGGGCDWCGDYSAFFQHSSCHSTNGMHAFVRPILHSPMKTPESRRKPRPTMAGLRSNSLPALIEGGREEDVGSPEMFSPRATIKFMSRSLRDLNALDEEDETATTNTGATGDTFPELYNSASLNLAIAAEPKEMPKEKITSAPKVALSPRKNGTQNGSNYSKLDTQARRKLFLQSSKSNLHNSSELETSYSRDYDWNASIASFHAYGSDSNHFDDSAKFGASANLENSASLLQSSFSNDSPDAEGFDLDLELEPDDQVDYEERRQQAFEKATKLKKQANAKFNKGDFIRAREVYTEGLETVADFNCETKEDHVLVSNMFSNRAVTYFREKRFSLCFEDCEKAINFDPTFDKSWIRKWRAIMALGKMNEALECLEEGQKACPESSKIEEELAKCRADKELYDKAMGLVEEGEFLQARDLLKPHARTTDNVSLLFLATRIDVAMGSIEPSLEKVNKALRLNPKHAEGLELRGFALFLGGDTEKGAHLLQEAYNANKENKNIRAELLHCQRTHAAMSQGRASVKRGRYSDAVQHFTDAIKHSGPVPPKAPLYSMLRLERAEASLLRKQFDEALKDCDEVIESDKENATAWTIRADVLVATGKLKTAQEELSKIRKSWGYDNPTIDEGWKRVDFEAKVQFELENLAAFVADLDKGLTDRLEMMTNCIVPKELKHKSTDELKGSMHSGKVRRVRRVKAPSSGESRTPEKRRSKPKEPKSPCLSKRRAAVVTKSAETATPGSPRKSSRRRVVKKVEGKDALTSPKRSTRSSSARRQ